MTDQPMWTHKKISPHAQFSRFGMLEDYRTDESSLSILQHVSFGIRDNFLTRFYSIEH